MSYHINYPGCKHLNPARHRKPLCYVVAWTILLILFAFTIHPAGKNIILKLIVPGVPEDTFVAADYLVDQLQSGKAPVDAVEAFCKEISDE